MGKYAQILDGIVQNIIILDDNIDKTPWSDPFDYLIKVDKVKPPPAVGDLYDGSRFSRPPPMPLNQQYSPDKYGQLLIKNFIESNQQRSLTSDQIFLATQSMNVFYTLLQTGDLQVFLDVSPQIPTDDTIITPEIVAQLQSNVQTYLAGQ